jgi:CRISPR-associated protein Csb1
MPESTITQFTDLLKPDGPVAIVIKQVLAPANEDDPIIFPPSYPLTMFKGRVHTISDGDYRVSVELPSDPKAKKNEKGADQVAGYNIDRFPDSTNSCEIDSPQSQANRMEPEFKKPEYCGLVPQIEIKVGNDTSGTIVNLLDAGHRAGDAIVRLSSLANEFHAAFLDVKAGNHFTLATLAPTSLLFGVWDSRSTQVKVQRALKSSIRAKNVRECTRSAQFTPAVDDYVAAGAVDADRDKDEGDQNPLSSEGMKHALAVQKAGGVMLTPDSELTRTVNLNLAAIRALKATDEPRTRALQAYILGLALVAATIDQDLNLREGCNLRFKDEEDAPKLVPRRGKVKPVALDHTEIVTFATASAREFFSVAGIPFEDKDHTDAIFETGVAEEFLGLEKKEDRDKVRALGPITAATLKRFRDQSSDPFKPVADLLAKAKKTRPKSKKGQPPVQDQATVEPVLDALRLLSEDPTIPENAKQLASELAVYLAGNQPDSHSALKHVETKLKAFKKSQKDATDPGVGTDETTPKE